MELQRLSPQAHEHLNTGEIHDISEFRKTYRDEIDTLMRHIKNNWRSHIAGQDVGRLEEARDTLSSAEAIGKLQEVKATVTELKARYMHIL